MVDMQQIIEGGGLALIAFMVFAESGMMIGFLFPGDTLLLGAGVFAAAGELPLVLSIIAIAVAAILGDTTGYFIGRFVGPKLFRTAGHLAHRKIRLTKAQRFFRQYGNKAMLIAHFIPYVRSVAPIVAGAIKMRSHSFFIFDAVGDIAWAISLTLIGYFVGERIPNIDQYLEPLIVISTVAFFVPFFARLACKLLHIRTPQIRFKFASSIPKVR